MNKLIGLAGRKRAGKDTVGGMIFDSAPGKFFVMAFATKLKEICADVYGFSEAQLYGDQKEVPDPRYRRPDGTCLTPREAMEKLGTEWARACYPDTWADRGLLQAQELRTGKYAVVITDVRFINEAKKIVDAGGEIWRVYRASADILKATHPAEQELDTQEFNDLVKHRIYNESTLEQLRGQVWSHLRGLSL